MNLTDLRGKNSESLFLTMKAGKVAKRYLIPNELNEDSSCKLNQKISDSVFFKAQ